MHIYFQGSIKNMEQKQWLGLGNTWVVTLLVCHEDAKEKCPVQGVPSEVPALGCAGIGLFLGCLVLLRLPWERKSRGWRKKLGLTQRPLGDISHLTLVGFSSVSRERRGIQGHFFSHWLFQAWSILPYLLITFGEFCIFFPWKFFLFLKRIYFLWLWEAYSSGEVGWTWNCCCSSFNLIFLLLEIYFLNCV